MESPQPALQDQRQQQHECHSLPRPSCPSLGGVGAREPHRKQPWIEGKKEISRNIQKHIIIKATDKNMWVVVPKKPAGWLKPGRTYCHSKKILCPTQRFGSHEMSAGQGSQCQKRLFFALGLVLASQIYGFSSINDTQLIGLNSNSRLFSAHNNERCFVCWKK